MRWCKIFFAFLTALLLLSAPVAGTVLPSGQNAPVGENAARDKAQKVWEVHDVAVATGGGLLLLLVLLSGGLGLHLAVVRRTMKRSREFLSALPGRIGVVNQHEKILYINAESASETAVLAAKTLRDIPNVDYPKISAAVAEVFRTRQRVMLEYDYKSVKRFMTIAPLEKHLFGENAVVWFSHDNTELQEARAQAEAYAAQLQNTTRMWDILINSLPIHIFAKDADREFRYVFNNKIRSDFFGIPVTEMNGRNDFDFMPEATATELRDIDQRSMENAGSPENTFVTLTDVNGKPHRMQVVQTPFVDADGTRLLLGAKLDVTEVEESRRILAEESELRDAMIQFIPFVFFAKDVDDQFRYVMGNEAFENFFGVSPGSLRGKTAADAFINAAEADPVPNRDREVVARGDGISFYEEVTAADGKVHHMKTYKTVFRGSNGRTLLLGASCDISEQVEMKLQAEENAEWLHLTLNSIGDGVIATDASGNIVMLNPVAERMLGVEQQKVIGLPHDQVFKIVGAYDGEPKTSPVLRSLRTGAIVELANHTDLLSLDGQRYHIADSAAPIFDHDRKIIGAILVFRDVTEEYESRDKLRRAVTSLEYAAELTGSAAFAYDPRTRVMTGTKFLPELWPIDANDVAVPLEEWVYPADQPRMEQMWRELNTGGVEASVFDYRAIKDGTIHYYRLKSSLDHSSPHQVRFIGVIQDITEITRNAMKLKDTTELWEQVINTIPIMFFVKDADNDFRYMLCNREFAGSLGMEREQLIGRNDVDLQVPEAELFLEDDRKAAASSEVCIFTCRAKMQDGAYRILEVFKKSFVGADGRRLLFGAARDITELHNVMQNEKAVKQSLSNVMLEPSFDGAFKRIASTLNSLFSCDRVTLAKCDGDGRLRFDREWHTEALVDMPQSGLANHHKAWDWHIDRLRNGEVIQYGDFAQSGLIEEYSLNSEDYTPPCAIIASPIFIDRVFWGALRVSFSKETRNFSSSDEQLMRSMSDIVALALIREHQQQEIKRSNLEKQLILDNINVPVWLHDGDGRLLQANTAAARIAGVPQEALNTERNWEIFGRDFPEGKERPVPAVIRTRKPVQQNIWFDGRDYIVNTHPIFSDDGRLIYIVKSSIDITDVNEMAKNLQVVNFCLETFFAEPDTQLALKEVVRVICNHMGASRCFVTKFNRMQNEAANLCEYAADGHAALFVKEKRIAFDPAEPWYQAFGRRELISWADTRGDGCEQYFGIWYGKVRQMRALHVAGVYLDGELWGDIGIAYDDRQYALSEQEKSFILTAGRMVGLLLERDRAQQQILTALDRARAADKAKSFFIASVSHEIRTPLNAVIGFAELLKDGGVSPQDRQEYLESIAYSGNALLQLVNDVLDLSTLEADQMRIVNEPVDFDALSREVMAVFAHSATAKQLAMNMEIPALPLLNLDKLRIRQILFNLIGNAVKFTPHGAVTLWADFTADSLDGGVFRFGVTDTGIGINPSDQRKLMEPFVQLSQMRGTNAANNGTGLGLSICKRLAEKMNGKLELESTPGRGSTFTVTLREVTFRCSGCGCPSAPNAASTMPVVVRRRGGRSVLLVDDVEMNLKVMTAMCRKAGVENVVCALSGKEALAALSRTEFGLVLTDIWMPEMNGAELAAAIRSNPDFADLPIVAVTADAEAKENFPQENFSGMLLKPITVAKIGQILETI